MNRPAKTAKAIAVIEKNGYELVELELTNMWGLKALGLIVMRSSSLREVLDYAIANPAPTEEKVTELKKEIKVGDFVKLYVQNLAEAYREGEVFLIEGETIWLKYGGMEAFCRYPNQYSLGHSIKSVKELWRQKLVRKRGGFLNKGTYVTVVSIEYDWIKIV